MKIIKRILLILFGILSGLIGFISLVVSITLMLAGSPDVGSIISQIPMIIFTFLICEILLGFGIAASFLSLHCIVGKMEWSSRIINIFWPKTMKYAMFIPVVGIGAGIIFKLIEFLMK